MQNGAPTYTEKVMKDPQLPPAQAMSQYIRGNSSGPFVQDAGYIMQYYQLQAQRDALQTWLAPTDERLMPPVSPTQDESRRFATIMNDVNSKYQEVFTKVVTGAESLETLAGLPAQLRTIGIDDAIKIQQAALERYNKRA